jgi:hypothetical protein
MAMEDKDNPNHLTLAEIYEVSLVGVGADPNALTSIKKGDAGNPPKEESKDAGRVLIVRLNIKKEEKLCQIPRLKITR